jgi:hypothetical protein
LGDALGDTSDHLAIKDVGAVLRCLALEGVGGAQPLLLLLLLLLLRGRCLGLGPVADQPWQLPCALSGQVLLLMGLILLLLLLLQVGWGHIWSLQLVWLVLLRGGGGGRARQDAACSPAAQKLLMQRQVMQQLHGIQHLIASKHSHGHTCAGTLSRTPACPTTHRDSWLMAVMAVCMCQCPQPEAKHHTPLTFQDAP